MNLTGTSLGEQVIHEIGTFLRRSRTLLSIHISANPGLSLDNRAYLTERIRCRKRDDIPRFITIQKKMQEMLKTHAPKMLDGLRLKVDRGYSFAMHNKNDPMQVSPADQMIF